MEKQALAMTGEDKKANKGEPHRGSPLRLCPLLCRKVFFGFVFLDDVLGRK